MIAPPLTPTPPKMGQLGARFDHHAVVALPVLMDFGTVQTADLAVRRTVEAERKRKINKNNVEHGLWTAGEDIAFTAQPKINSHSQIFRYG